MIVRRQYGLYVFGIHYIHRNTINQAIFFILSFFDNDEVHSERNDGIVDEPQYSHRIEWLGQ